MKMSNTEAILIDRVKAYGFPIVLAVVAFFMMRLINGIDSIQQDLVDIKVEQAKQQGLINGNIQSIEKRLQVIENKINEWE
jgi:hypothetical protein